MKLQGKSRGSAVENLQVLKLRNLNFKSRPSHGSPSCIEVIMKKGLAVKFDQSVPEFLPKLMDVNSCASSLNATAFIQSSVTAALEVLPLLTSYRSYSDKHDTFRCCGKNARSQAHTLVGELVAHVMRFLLTLA